MRTIVMHAATALTLAACAAPPTSGTIYERPFAGVGYWYSTDCGMSKTVTRTRNVTTYDSKGKASTRTQTSSEQVCVMWLQNAHVVPAWWELCLRADDNPGNTACRRVDEATYHRYPVGAHFPDAQ